MAVRVDRPPAAHGATTHATAAPASTTGPSSSTDPDATNRDAGGATADASSTTTVSSVPPADTETSPPPSAPPIDPGPLRPTVPGGYRVRIVDDQSSRTGLLRVDGAGHQTTSVDGSTWTRFVRFSSTGDSLIASHEPNEPDCVWTPAPLVLPSDPHEGLGWTSTATCTTSGPDGSAAVTRDEDASITSRARTTYDGRPLDCWLVRRHVVETMRSVRMTITTESVRSELFSPTLGLAVYSVERMEVPDADDGSTRTAVWSTELLGSSPS